MGKLLSGYRTQAGAREGTLGGGETPPGPDAAVRAHYRHLEPGQQIHRIDLQGLRDIPERERGAGCSGNLDAAGQGRKQADERLDQRRFAGPVRPRMAVKLARAIERESPDSTDWPL